MYLVTSIPSMVRSSWDTMSMFLHMTGTRRLKEEPRPAGRVEGSILPFNLCMRWISSEQLVSQDSTAYLSQEEEGDQAPNDSSPSMERILPFCRKSELPVLILK